MSRCVDLDERVTAQFYDEECEEWTMQTCTIEDVLDSVCDEYTVLQSGDIREQSVDIGYLYEWYQDSVNPDDEPIWTKKHIEEIFHDFYLIPKQESKDG